jgi:Type I phosphodiesterase / nucleotide pyrophosphatase
VVEFVNQQPAYKNSVVAFTSWDAFPAIINADRNKMLVNSGIALYRAPKLSEAQQLLNDMTSELPFLGETRPDAITFHLAFEYLKQNKPSVLFLSFDETDHFAHEGKYDLYLNSARYTDGFISKLWGWLQTQRQYKDKTTLIISTDHGRGGSDMEMWRHHGKRVEGADQIWLAILGPDTPALGEVKTEGQLYQNQVAKTLAAFLGFNFVNDKKNEGAAIQTAY